MKIFNLAGRMSHAAVAVGLVVVLIIAIGSCAAAAAAEGDQILQQPNPGLGSSSAKNPISRRMGGNQLQPSLRERLLIASTDDQEQNEKEKLQIWAVQFEGFVQKYGKRYATVEEARECFAVFIANVKRIQAHNKENRSYKLGINEFTDMTFEEFSSTHLMQMPQDCSATVGNHINEKAAPLPAKVDWREKNIVSPVKNQGSCGSCWAFSTTGAVEAAWTQSTGENVSLSEQQLVDCAQNFSNNGCNGGLPSQGFEYVKYNGGLDTEASYPYTAQDGNCGYKPSKMGAKVYDVFNITMGSEEDLKNAVAFQRPVSIAFQVVADFQSYSSGVYSSTACSSDPKSVNHAVLAVGYVAEEGKMPYWIVKNSWGKTWGLEGYFLIEQGKNMCGLASCASYPVVSEC